MKKLLVVLAALIVLAVPSGVYAATSESSVARNIRGVCGLGVNGANLTEQQKADLDESFDKMVEVRKESINKMVQDGLMTKEQGDLALERLNDRVEYHNENGYGYGMGSMVGGYGNGRGMMDGNGFGRCVIDGE